MNNKESVSGWPGKPRQTVIGQQVFWNQQAGSYEHSDLTNHNPGEMEGVQNFFSERKIDELIVLGGAVGCRDPKMILRDSYCGQHCVPGQKKAIWPKIVFNDLSPSQVAKAEQSILSDCLRCGVKIRFASGPIRGVCRLIPPAKNRALALGVYGLESFFSAFPEGGIAKSGFDDYVSQRATLGEYFWFDWVGLEGCKTNIIPGERLLIGGDYDQGEFLNSLQDKRDRFSQKRKILALRIMSCRRNWKGYFISHWFCKEALGDYLSRIFSDKEFSVSRSDHPKGATFFIEGKSPTSSCITLLNNVLGNIRNCDQFNSLQAVKTIMMGP